MGSLIVTPLTNTSSVVCKGTVDNQPSDSTVYAEIKINAQVYRYQISGVPFSCLGDMPALVAHLQYILETQRYKPEQHTDDDYGVPRQLTFSAAGKAPQSQVIVSSARALYNFLVNAIKHKESKIKELVINQKAQFYSENQSIWLPWFFNGALEMLPKTFAKIKPIHLPALTTLQLYMAHDSARIILGITDLLRRNCLPNLKTLDLQFAGLCRPGIHKEGWIHTNDVERIALYNLYKSLANASTLPSLEHFHLPLWCAYGTELGLATLRRFYSGLKTLTVDMIIPTAVSEGMRLNWSSSFTGSSTVPNGYGYTTNIYTIDRESYSAEFRIPEPEEMASQFSFLDFLEEMRNVSQLECLEIYDWPIRKSIVAECSILEIAIAKGWLPKLNTIALRFNLVERHNYLLETTINPKTEMDVSSLLKAVIDTKVPLKKLFLIMPEKNGYQGWLDEMKTGNFPELEQFHYRLPDRWLGESDPAYHARVEKALDTLYTAIRKGQLPKLKAFIVEGNHAVQMKLNIEAPPLPKYIWTKIEDIEEAIHTQPSAPSLSLFSLERELTIDASSMVFNTLESNQVA
jgi:hypothetical protein